MHTREKRKKRREHNIRSVWAGVLMIFPGAGEHDEKDFSVTKNSKFFSFLENTISSLGVSDLPVCGVFDLLDLNLSTTHSGGSRNCNGAESDDERRIMSCDDEVKEQKSEERWVG